jgi:hypothetical protein
LSSKEYDANYLKEGHQMVVPCERKEFVEALACCKHIFFVAINKIWD